jgi:hypothetical protein
MNLTLGIFTLLVGSAATALVAARHRRIARPLFVGFLARALFAFVDNLYWGLSRGGDGRWWDYWAAAWANRGLVEVFSHITTGHDLYKFLMALLYYFVGRSSLMIQVINAFLGTLVILYAWKLATIVGGDDRTARRAAWVVALFPSIILHSGMLLREVAVTLPLTVGVYHLAAWHRRRRSSNAVCAAAALLTSMAFHSGAFAVILALTVWVAGSWVRAVVLRRPRLVLRTSAALVLAGAVVVFAAETGWGMEKFRAIDMSDLGSLSRTQEHAARGRTAYLQDLRANTLPELFLQSPVRAAYFLFAPFPWMTSGVRDAIGLVDALLFLWLGVRLLRGKKLLRENPTALMVVALFAAMAFTFALGVSNYGTAFRHRNKMLPMLVAVAVSLPLARRQHALGFSPIEYRHVSPAVLKTLRGSR